MTDPKPSAYDQHPVDPNAKGDGGGDPGESHVPELAVAWDTRPSFNLDPKDIDQENSGPPGTTPSAPSDAFKVDLKGVGDQVNSMLGSSRTLVSEYEALKAKVNAGQGTVFGQTSMSTGKTDNPGNTYLPPGTYNPPGSGDTHSPTDFQPTAKQFANVMNPHQQKALEDIGGVLELVGQYIALVNHAGQVYAQSDRQSKFPDPPASST